MSFSFLLTISRNYIVHPSNVMAKKLILFISLLTSIAAMAALDTTQTGIPLNTEWKQKVYEYAKQHVKHSAWGIAHSERDYQLSIWLAEQEGINADTDVIFAAAFLHDIGAIEPFRNKDVEHSIRSTEIAESLLESYGFPMQKWVKVKAVILGHMYYADLPIMKEAIIFHDADALDFFGIIGIVRLISITERHAWAGNLAEAFTTLHRFKKEIPHLLMTTSAKKMAEQRILEMKPFFSLLNQETFDNKAL